MTTQLRIGKALQKQLLKCVVQYISSRSEWVKWISQLAKATTLVVNGSRSKQKKQKCLKCTKLFDNYLLLVLHLQLSHQDLIQIGRYEFDKQTLTLTISQKSAHKTSFFYCKTQSHEFQLLYSIQTRRERILQSLCAKFSKKQTIEPNQQTKYFHPVNVFRHLGQMEEDQEDPYGNIEEELQRIKISEFTDVNQNDKQFFIKWNQAVRKAKKEHVYLTENVMSALLESFAVEAGRSGLKRSNLLMHGFTLWSSGKISSSDVIMFLNAYDKNNNTT